VKPLKNKKLTILMIEKEYNEPFWFTEPTNKPTSNLSALQKPSIALTSFLEKLVTKIKPDFATEELGLRSIKKFNEDNALSKFFQSNKIPFYPVDIDENARAYISQLLGDKGELRDKIIQTLNKHH
jgi:hypothetical protein